MKFFIGFLIGLVCGIVAVIGFRMFTTTNGNKGLALFSEKGPCITTETLKAMQVISDNKALVVEYKDLNFNASKEDSLEWVWNFVQDIAGNSSVMLLIAAENQHLYDDMIVKIPTNSCARQVGTYKYLTQKDVYKTIPVVRIEAI